MASVNKVIILGNCGGDPEVRTFPSGDRIATVSVATTDKWKDKQTGEPKEHTEWHRLIFTGRLADVAADFLRKGNPVYVEGAIRQREYDQNGERKFITEIRVSNMQLLGSREDRGGGRDRDGNDDRDQRSRDSRSGGSNRYQQERGAPARQNPASRSPAQSTGFDDMDDDIPF